MLTINDLTYRLGSRLLFDKATVALPLQARIGLVGRNGSGKTTLFRLIAGDLSAESGSIAIPRRMRLGRVEQEAPGGDQALIDFVLSADRERAALLDEAETASAPHRIAEIQARLADISAHSAPARAAGILAGLGFPHDVQRRALGEFSGGWRMRVALAAVLFSEPDLLLLDEPTNYLDLEGTLWLIDYLKTYPATLIVISHDRDLLDAVADHILSLEQMKLSLFRGNYSGFERQRREQQAVFTKERNKQEERRRHLQQFVDRFRAKATKARQAQSRLKMLARMEPIATLVDNAVQPFHFPSPARRLRPPIVALEGASVGYSEKAVLARLDLSISDDDRIALLGANGNGKSTFAKFIAGRLPPMSGKVIRAPKLEAGFFAQHQIEELDAKGTPYSHVAPLMPLAAQAQIRGRCAQIGFPGQKADTLVSELSGGEKARLLMGLATFAGPHLMILDEPTNHLDIDSRSALMEAINDYEGAVILVSHDRYLIEACAERLWLVADGTVRPFDGDLDDYRRLVLDGPASTRAADKRRSQRSSSEPDARPRQSAAHLRRRIDALEERMNKLQELLARVDEALAKPDAFTREPDRAVELARQRGELEKALVATENEWLELTEAVAEIARA